MAQTAAKTGPLIETFKGFTDADFAIFEIPEFKPRMTELKARLTPRLRWIAAELAPCATELLEEPIYPHVAQHLRRSVNPAVATWAALARAPRAYKPYAHYRASVSAEGARISVFVEDYADDKQLFAEQLGRNAAPLSHYLAHHPDILCFSLLDADGEPLRGHALSEETLSAFSARMLRVKGQHAVFGISIPRSHSAVASQSDFLEAARGAIADLAPLYNCGRPGYTFSYPPAH